MKEELDVSETPLEDEQDLGSAPPSSAAAAIERALLVNMRRTELILVRHGQQDFTLARARPGKTDPPLTELGHRQAASLARRLAGESIAHVYCSDLRRAQETASHVAQALRSGTTVLPELCEVRLFRDLPADRPLAEILGHEVLAGASAEFLRTRRFDAFPSTEPSAELRARAVKVLSALAERHAGERVVVVAHGGFINAFIAEVLGIDQDMFFFPAHASVTRMLFNDRWALYSANETSHLVVDGGSLVSF